MVRIVRWKKKTRDPARKSVSVRKWNVKNMKKYFDQKGKTCLIYTIGQKCLLFTNCCFFFSTSFGNILPLLVRLLLWLSHTYKTGKGHKTFKVRVLASAERESADIPLETFSFSAPKKRSWWRTGFLNCFKLWNISKFFTLLSINYIQWGCTKNL